MFDSARIKVRRAIRHIDEVQACVAQEVANTDGYRIFAEPNPQGSGNILYLEITRPLRPAYALSVGDAIHNLRTSLDHAASDMARREERDNAHVQFPFDETREGLEKSREYRAIKRSRPDIASTILNLIKPYKAGNYPLWALNKLDNIDKHKLLIPVLSATALVGVCAKSDSGGGVENCTFTAQGPGRFPFIGFVGRLEITNYGKPAFDVFFPEGQLFERQSVIPALHSLSKLVLETIETLEFQYFGAPR